MMKQSQAYPVSTKARCKRMKQIHENTACSYMIIDKFVMNNSFKRFFWNHCNKRRNLTKLILHSGSSSSRTNRLWISLELWLPLWRLTDCNSRRRYLTLCTYSRRSVLPAWAACLLLLCNCLLRSSRLLLLIILLRLGWRSALLRPLSALLRGRSGKLK